jgi:hypothetical protein
MREQASGQSMVQAVIVWGISGIRFQVSGFRFQCSGVRFQPSLWPAEVAGLIELETEVLYEGK